MKIKLFWIYFVVASSIGARAQTNTTTTSFMVDGIKVIFKPTQKKVINIRMYFRGGVTNYKASQAGIENLALRAAAGCGTKKYTANAMRDSLEKYDVGLFGESTMDYGFIQLNCISMYFNQGWDIFSETINSPVFDEREVDLLKIKQLTEIKRSEANPANHLFTLQKKAAFANTLYDVEPNGTEQTVNGFTAADLRDYFTTMLNKNKIFIVAVGNINKQALFEKILYSFGGILAAPYTPVELKASGFIDNKLVTEARNLKINYVGAVMAAPNFTSDDYVPFRLAFTGIGGNFYREVRTHYHLSYSPSNGLLTQRMPVALLSASTNYPREVMAQMMAVVKAAQNGGYDDEWLQHLKNIYITGAYFDEQSSAEVTHNLGLAEILGNWQYADDLPQLVNMVTVEQLNRAINYYITGFRWAYLGNLDAINGFKTPVY